MSKIIIKKSEFKKLYDIACDSWKLKFIDKVKDFIFNEAIEFESNFVDEMQKACTKEQLPIFNKLFKTYLKTKVNLFSIKSYLEVCKALKENPETCPYKKIKQIEKLFNDGEKKCTYYPYFSVDSGGGLVYCDYCSCSSGFYGQVALYKDSETATYVGKTFIKEYTDLKNDH